ncbi:hypothetical protein FB45DRAFT_944724 [Roridomyces roridus]|uniref:Uncharacterized protein n=1 Tax=Roridomyces roridus TaxID=1738132 RepID=A0AAD7B3B4_9AGAR|nr:hypothetical protein FB45DRAFT_944724 [Roridomyces roridus]
MGITRIPGTSRVRTIISISSRGTSVTTATIIITLIIAGVTIRITRPSNRRTRWNGITPRWLIVILIILRIGIGIRITLSDWNR